MPGEFSGVGEQGEPLLDLRQGLLGAFLIPYALKAVVRSQWQSGSWCAPGISSVSRSTRVIDTQQRVPVLERSPDREVWFWQHALRAGRCGSTCTQRQKR